MHACFVLLVQREESSNDDMLLEYDIYRGGNGAVVGRCNDRAGTTVRINMLVILQTMAVKSNSWVRSSGPMESSRTWNMTPQD